MSKSKDIDWRKWGIIGLLLSIAGIAVFLVVKFWGVIQDFFGRGKEGTKETETMIKKRFNAVSYQSSKMTITKSEARSRAVQIWDAVNCEWDCPTDGTDEMSIYDALDINTLGAITGGNASFLTPDDLKAIYKEFGLRTYSDLEGGQPTWADGFMLGTGDVLKLDMIEVLRRDMAANEFRWIEQAYQYANVV